MSEFETVLHEKISLLKERRVSLWVAIVAFVVLGGTLAGLQFAYDRVTYYNLLLPRDGETQSPLIYGSWPALQNAAFFKEVRTKFILEKADFIEADLSAMKLTVFLKGVRIKEVPIASKGKEGSWWETPAGVYRVLDKEKEHFSSFGSVYMPWSMPFHGNFFIHGWPYYPDQIPVGSGYSGGCIRLSTEDAKGIYELATVGMPVLVFENDFESDGLVYAQTPPLGNAEAYLVADIKSNFVIASQNAQKEFPIASLAKLMTAIIAAEHLNLEREIEIMPGDLVPTSKPRLRAGTSVSVYNLLRLLLTESSNEAASVFSRTLGSVRITELMNEKAKAIGMNHSHFADSSGISPENTGTAEDLFLLAKYLYHNRSFILKITSGIPFTSAYADGAFSDLKNFNLFTETPGFLGGKVGKTSLAQETLIALFSFQIFSEKRPVAVILLKSPDVWADGNIFVSWITSRYAP